MLMMRLWVSMQSHPRGKRPRLLLPQPQGHVPSQGRLELRKVHTAPQMMTLRPLLRHRGGAGRRREGAHRHQVQRVLRLLLPPLHLAAEGPPIPPWRNWVKKGKMAILWRSSRRRVLCPGQFGGVGAPRGPHLPRRRENAKWKNRRRPSFWWRSLLFREGAGPHLEGAHRSLSWRQESVQQRLRRAYPGGESYHVRAPRERLHQEVLRLTGARMMERSQRLCLHARLLMCPLLSMRFVI